MESRLSVEVGGETFDVVARRGRPGEYEYTWTSGPNQGYGFSSASSDGAPSTVADHESAIRNFLSQVDRGTGYVE
jgi:hypothetical protein